MAGLLEKDYGRGWFDDAEPQGGWGNYLSLQGGPDPSQGQAAPQSPERMDPSRMLWAGAIMDVGNAFGSALAGTGASQGNAMRLYGAAKDHNQQLDQRAVQMREMERQRAIEAEERALNEEYVRSQIARNQATVDAAGNPVSKPIGSPQRMADGSLAQTVQNPDGTIDMVPLGKYANEGKVVDFGGVPFFLNPLSNTVASLGGGGYGGGGQPATLPQQAPQQQQPQRSPGGQIVGDAPRDPSTPPRMSQGNQAASEQQPGSRPPQFTPEELARQEAERESAVERARAEARQGVESAGKAPERQEQLDRLQAQLGTVDRVLGSIDDVNFGTLQGYLPGSIVGAEDDFFDSLASLETLKNSSLISGSLSEDELRMLRQTTLDRNKSREFNEAELEKVRGLVQKAIGRLQSQLPGSSAALSDDELINRYLD